MQLSMALIFAKNMERMTAFYRDAIGLEFLASESSDGLDPEGNVFSIVTG